MKNTLNFEKKVNKNLQKIKAKDLMKYKDFEILVPTPSGMQAIGDFYVKERNCVMIKTDSGIEEKVSEDHLFMTPDGWVYAKDSIGKQLVSKDGLTMVLSVEEIGLSEVYDFEVLHDTHTYYTASGLASHNTGKTFLILNACREAQKMGYFIIYGDSEAAVDEDLMKKFGLDPSRVRYQPLKTVLQTRHVVKNLCKTLKDKVKAGFEIPKIMFIIDSLGNLATEKETEDATTGSDKRDMTKQQNLKSLFRIITGELAELKIPLIISNHVYASVGSYIPMNVQSGGCMIPGTKVRTCEGLKNIEDIVKGELIPTLGGDKKVDAVWTFEKPTYKITLEGGLEYQVSDNHRFLINQDYSNLDSWKYITDIKEDDILLGCDNKTFKVLKVEESGTTKVHDLTVRDVEHYILESGVISHNTGMVYATSFICDLSKAGLDEAAEGQDSSLKKSGIVVTSKVTKGRFARPIPIKFHISFYKGMNPYVGLENYVSWEACGIGRGKLIEEILETPIYEEDGVTQKILRGKPAVKKEKTGNWIYEEDPDAKTFAVKHLNKVVKGSALFTKEVFTDEVLDMLDEKVIRPMFELPEIMGDEEELDGILEEEGTDDTLGLDEEA